MTDLFRTEKKFFSAMSSYVLLLQSLTSIRAYSGATRLYLLTGLGVTLAAAGDIELLKKNLAADDILVEPPLHYIKTAIGTTCATYAALLGEHITNRLATRGDQDKAPAGDARGVRFSYNIPIFLAQELERLVDPDLSRQQIWGKATLFQNLADMMQLEFAHTANMQGKLLANPRQDEIVKRFVSRLDEIFLIGNTDDYTPREFHMPILKILLVIARLLYADFRDLQTVPKMGTLQQRFWLSDSTLAAMPWPSPAFVEVFEERDASLISTEGWRYLHYISEIYPDRM